MRVFTSRNGVRHASCSQGAVEHEKLSERANRLNTAHDLPLTQAEESIVSVKNLNVSLGGVSIYENFDLEIEKGKVTALFGPNGCGKSTLLNVIAGLIPYDSGSITFDGKSLAEFRLGFVFQNYRDALFPWMSAFDNICYPLKFLGFSKKQAQARAQQLVKEFDISFDLSRFPYQMSGGQQQLVSILRALAPDPQVICLDEPFSALDYEMTLFVRDMLQQLFIKTNKTLIIVSHDLEEAIWLADNVVLLTRRPTRVSEVVKSTIERPRDMDTLANPSFVTTKSHALHVFQREVRKGSPA